ncbi:MAG: radical SAM family RiPP maturation amino acid epimerase [Kiritimatiellae bacterium]|nr:radical SAM family RiPP maturation amino acid epimerase [Kiritimatiellia bacterium]
MKKNKDRETQSAAETGRCAPVGMVKRFLELWTSGPAFKAEVLKDPQGTMHHYGLDVDPEDIRALWDWDYAAKAVAENLPVTPTVKQYREFINEKLRWRELVREECSPAEHRFKTWRDRQIKRNMLEIGVDQDSKMIHTPVAFELAYGCSMKCWFCALNAPPLQAVYEYTPENRNLFRAILAILKDVAGPSAKWGCSYWATEPLDNPNYEKFCMDFYDILGIYPQTTTADPMRDPARLRKILADSRARGCLVNRFSIMTLQILERVHREFTPDELQWVELILQNAEADPVKAVSGRFTERNRTNPKLAEREKAKVLAAIKEQNKNFKGDLSTINVNLPGTTSCMTGFRINMVKKTVELASPCNACEKWPNGYIVFESGTFNTAEDFKSLVDGMVERVMLTTVPADRRLRLGRVLKYSHVPNGFQVASISRGVQVANEASADMIRMIGDLIRDGQNTACEIALLCFYQLGVPTEVTMGAINHLFENGMLDEEPDNQHTEKAGQAGR